MKWITDMLKDYADKLHTQGTINFKRDWEKKLADNLLVIAASLGDGILYEFLYNGFIHESSWATISIHRTKEGAEKAMNEHKEKARQEWLIAYPTIEEQEEMTFGMFEDWRVVPVEVKD